MLKISIVPLNPPPIDVFIPHVAFLDNNFLTRFSDSPKFKWGNCLDLPLLCPPVTKSLFMAFVCVSVRSWMSCWVRCPVVHCEFHSATSDCWSTTWRTTTRLTSRTSLGVQRQPTSSTLHWLHHGLPTTSSFALYDWLLTTTSYSPSASHRHSRPAASISNTEGRGRGSGKGRKESFRPRQPTVK